MRRRVHEDADVGEMAQREPERDVALLLVERHDAHLARGMAISAEGGRETARATRFMK